MQGELRAQQEMIRSSLDEVRHVARRLRPGVLDDLGPFSAISSLATDLSEVSRLPPLRRETELVLHRIAQASLTNVARHTEASHVELPLTAEEEQLLRRIVDDGRGMDGRCEAPGSAACVRGRCSSTPT